MSKITKEMLIESLIQCGIKKGDTVLVHSDISLLGPTLPKTRVEILEMFYSAFVEVLGDDGTLCVPAYFYEYARWSENFDLTQSPVSKELGVLSSYVAKKEGSLRSHIPISAISAIGKNAEYICNGNAISSYGVDSPWDRLFKSGFKMIFLGIDLRCMTFIHYVEHMVGVPHTYTKLYNTPIFKNGNLIKDTSLAQVRFLKYNISYDALKFTEKFESGNIVKEVTCGRGLIRCVNGSDAFDFLNSKLKEDIYYLLKTVPEFVQGEIPMDGSAGAAKK